MCQTNKSFVGMKVLCVFVFIGFVIVEGLENGNVTEMQFVRGRGFYNRPLMVGLTLINGAAAKGAGNPSYAFIVHLSLIVVLFFRLNVM